MTEDDAPTPTPTQAELNAINQRVHGGCAPAGDEAAKKAEAEKAAAAKAAPQAEAVAKTAEPESGAPYKTRQTKAD